MILSSKIDLDLFIINVLRIADMNLYDKKIIKCVKCNKQLGEIDIGTKIIYSICQSCHDKNTKRQTIEKQKPLSFNFLNKRLIETVPS